MPTIQKTDGPVWMRRTSLAQFLTWFAWLIGITITVFAWARISDNDLLWVYMPTVGAQAADMISRMVPPKWSYMDVLWIPVWDTINIATIGTLMAMIIAVPVAFAAATNTTPHKAVRAVALLIIVSSRSVNSLIWALAWYLSWAGNSGRDTCDRLPLNRRVRKTAL